MQVSASDDPERQQGIPVYTVTINGRRTSVRLHDLERDVLREICRLEGISLSQFCERAIADHGERNRSASLRLAMLSYFIERWPYFQNAREDRDRSTGDGQDQQKQQG